MAVVRDEKCSNNQWRQKFYLDKITKRLNETLITFLNCIEYPNHGKEDNGTAFLIVECDLIDRHHPVKHICDL